ncbi:hypothetical protein V1504DRAFT_462937, partial [Lipomyces starkeyi]
MGKRIVFTGGSGKAGRHAIEYLLSAGHSVLNLDLVPLENPSDDTRQTDATDVGQVVNALTSHFTTNGCAGPSIPGPPDVVMHFAAYPRNMIVPDDKTFKTNVLSTYNDIEAACKLGVRKIIIASSETTYGVCCTQGDTDFHSFPLEEEKKLRKIKKISPVTPSALTCNLPSINSGLRLYQRLRLTLLVCDTDSEGNMV